MGEFFAVFEKMVEFTLCWSIVSFCLFRVFRVAKNWFAVF